MIYFYSLAVPVPVQSFFTYSHSEELAAGLRVLVSFGKRTLVAVVIERTETPQTGLKIKPILSVIDDTPIYSAHLLELGKWMSRYYHHPLGEVLRAMLPASEMRQVRKSYRPATKLLTSTKPLLNQETHSNPDLFGLDLSSMFNRIVSTEESKDGLGDDRKGWLAKIRSELKVNGNHGKSALTGPTAVFETFVSSGWLQEHSKKSPTVRSFAPVFAVSLSLPPDQVPPCLPLKRKLTEEQQSVFLTVMQQVELSNKLGKPQPVLIQGVTGSGKTEVYMQVFEQVLNFSAELSTASSQVLLLVPEISLTPQMTTVFSQRFGADRIAVVHSGLSDSQRWIELEKIYTGRASILIGPRSAVFAPFLNLKLIAVDEEHDSSYKQQGSFAYSARDIAILRAKMLGIPVVLGSATPSLESYANAAEGRYIKAILKQRVTGRPMPEISFLNEDLRKLPNPIVSAQNVSSLGQAEENEDILVDSQVVDALRQNYQEGGQAIVLINRRGYANFLLDLSTGVAALCPKCSVSLTLHKKTRTLRCHYCDYSVGLVEFLSANSATEFMVMGRGSERWVEMLQRSLAPMRFARLDSDTTRRKDFLPRTLDDFRRGDLDVLVGTQMLAKGHDFPNVTLVVMLDIDRHLDLPDFRAAERCFQLIVQAAGRAGRAEKPGKVLLQTMRGQSDPTILAAVQQNYDAFAARELELRRVRMFPPCGKMAMIEANSTDLEILGEFRTRWHRWLGAVALEHSELKGAIRIVGPVPAPIERINHRSRLMVVVSSRDQRAISFFIGLVASAFSENKGDLRIKIDVDPQALL